MKLIAIDPLWNGLVTAEQQKQLENAGYEIIVVSDVKPIAEVKELFEGEEERVLVVNPDFVDWSLKSEDYEKIPNLKCIVLESTSFSYVNFDAANKAGIPIVNIRNFSTDSLSEWTLMMVLATARKVPLMMKAGFPLNFGSDFMEYKGYDLKGRTLGIVGLGNIASALAEKFQAIGMNVQYWSRKSRNENYKYVELDELFSTSDVVIPVMASNDETNKIITDEMINSMKSDAIFVGITHRDYNYQLIIDKVARGELYGYAWEDEKPGNFNNYEGNVWAAPAYGWTTDNTMAKSMDRTVEAAVLFAKGETPNRVN